MIFGIGAPYLLRVLTDWRRWAVENFDHATFAIDRANRDAWNAVGNDTKKGLRTLLALAMIGVAVNSAWLIPALKSVVVLTGLYVLFWAWFFDAAWVNPSTHKRWLARVTPSPERQTIVLELLSKVGHQGLGIACEITFPSGERTRAEQQPIEPGEISAKRRFRCGADGDFPNAPSPTSGSYFIAWFEQERGGKWHKILREPVELELV